MACGDKKASCKLAILDPELTVTQPAKVTALTGLDAVVHAVETYVTKRRNPVSLAFSREAWRLLEANFTRVLENPGDLEARGAMQLGASFAGWAIENSMLGAAHALANPLTSHFEVPHGLAVGIMLPHVVRFNGAQCGHWYGELLHASVGENGAPLPEAGAAGLADFIAELVRRAELPTQLRECGAIAEKLPDLAAEAAKQWTAGHNPRSVGEADMRQLYEAAW